MIIVSCCNDDGGIFGINEDTLQVYPIVKHEARGLAVEDNFIFVSTHKGLKLYRREQDPTKWQLVAKYDAEQNWHGIAIRDAIVYSAVSKQHTILCFDKLLNQYIPERYDLPKAYPNDLFFYNGDLYYCLPRVGEIRRWPLEVPLFKDLQMPHSLHVTNDYVYTCNSAIGQVIRFPRYSENEKFANGNFEKLLKVREYTRGLYLNKHHLWIGLSRHRKTNRDEFRCGVIRKNLSNGAEDFIPLPAHEVYDITKM